MRAVQYHPEHGIRVVDVERHDPAEGEVEVRIAYTGLCGTDLHIVDGHMNARVPRPLVFGHETSGTVSRLGAGVESWAEGEPVSVVPLVWDGTCAECLAGYLHVCPNMRSLGIDVDGSLREHWSVPASKLVRVPAGTPMTRAALLEPLAVALHDVRRSGVRAGELAVVIGGGPIGALIATLARRDGVEVIVSEPSAWRRAHLESEGLTALSPDEIEDAVAAASAGRGADVVFEVSGSAAGAAVTTRLVGVRGRIVIVGVHAEPRLFDLHRVFWREVAVIGARVYEAVDVEAAASLIARADFLDRFVSTIHPLEGIADALAATRAGTAMKVLVAS